MEWFLLVFSTVLNSELSFSDTGFFRETSLPNYCIVFQIRIDSVSFINALGKGISRFCSNCRLINTADRDLVGQSKRIILNSNEDKFGRIED